ncbi:MAG TPA: DUF2905 domain-containing protein [Candidatus Limnocylindria bacterium]|nr:DUF2905 domain-containing protein [Candidatus Limnocylindria bacterium]
MSGMLIVAGLVLIALGLAFAFVPGMGRLPGDVTLSGDGWTVYAPIGTSIVLSVLLTLALALFRRTR